MLLKEDELFFVTTDFSSLLGACLAASGSKKNPNTAHTNPTSPNTVNTVCHPAVAIKPPASNNPNALPQLKAANTVLSPTLFWSLGIYFATAAAALGTAHPLAAPNRNRAAIK